MKNKKLIHEVLMAVMLLPIFTTAQTWPMPGANWTYCLTGWNGMPAGEEVFKVTADTVISGTLYNVIKPVNIDKETLYEENVSIRTLYTRYINDTIYRYVNNQEYMFFTFDLNVGDIFSTFRTAGWNYHWEDSACSSILPLKVIEESEIELDGLMLKKFILEDTLFHYLYGSTNQESIYYVLIERIGVLNSYPMINTMEPSGSCTLPSDYGLAALGKYTDDSFEYLFEDCEGMGINDKVESIKTVEVFPNPANQFIEVVQKNNLNVRYNISLLTELGNLIFIYEMNENRCTIDISGYQTGYYVVVLTPYDNMQNRIFMPIIISH
jgi:hypothetical protein